MKISNLKCFFKRKKERRKNYLIKNLALFLIGLLSCNTFGTIIANAATGNSGVGLELISGIIAPPITIDGEVAYCLNLYKNFPVATNYGDGNPYYDNRISSILYYGYPVNASGLQGKYGVTNEQARYYTQVAIWQIMGDLTTRNYGIGYIDELLQLGRNGTLPNSFFEVAPNSLNAEQKGGYQETQAITTKGSNGTFTFPSDSNVWSVDSNGNKKNTFNVGETFKIRATQGFNGEKRVGIKSSLTKPASLKYDGGNGYQDIVKYYNDPIQRNDDLSIKFNGTGKIVLKKTDDLGNVLPGVKFGLFSDKACTNKVKEAVTNNNGVLEFNNVTAGKYFVKELETLKSHVLSVEVKEVNVVGGDTQTVNYTNNIIKGRVKVIKVDEETGEKLQGAEFELRNKATGQVVEKLVTAADGTATSGLHPYAEYILQETKAPGKYTLNGKEYPITINQNLQTIEVTHQNGIIKGRVKVTKVDEETGEKLQGAEFELRNKATGQVVEKLVTGEDGTATSGLHPYAEYILKETKAPDKYTLNGKEHLVTINQNLQTIEVTHQNRIIKGRVKVTKVDEETGEKLQGAEFELRNKETGQVVEKLVTGVDGTATSGLHPYAEYILKETKAPNKYTLNSKEYLVTINKDLETIEVTHQNRIIKGRVEIIKEDSEIAGLKIPGAVFGIYDLNNTLVEELTTDKNGRAISGLLNYGDYKLREISPAKGYRATNKEWNIQIREDQKTYTYNITNDVIKAKIQIVKVDSKQADKPVEGAVFDVLAKSVFGIKPGTVVDTITTDKNGFAFTKDLRRGDYDIIETSVGNDYYLDKNKYTVSIAEHGKTVVKHIKNEPVKMKLRVIKTDGETKFPIKNTKFKIIDKATGEDIKFTEFFGIIPIQKTVFKTNKNGEIVFSQDLKAGNYSLVETEAAKGYKLIDPIDFTIDRNTDYEEIELLGKVHTLEVENTRIKGNVELIKIDADTKEPMKNVEFLVECLDSFDKGKTWTYFTGKDGKVKLENFNYGKYQITEVKTLEGYVLNSKPIPFEIRENGQNIKLKMTNDRIKGNVELIKIDEDTKRPLKNVEFLVESLDSFDKGKTWTYFTGEDGKIKLENFNYGKYQITEIKTLDEYVLNTEPIPFEVTENGQNISLTATNKVKEGDVEFTKTDVSTGELIDGAKIQIKGLDEHNKHIKIEFISSKEGNKFKVPVGRYEFIETVAPEGYILSEEVGTFEIKENEITKAELKNERIVGELEFTKTDVSTGEVLEGAKIKIECIEGFNKGKVIEFTSSKEGNKFSLEYGKYRITETMSPEGYELSTEVKEFEIKENGQIVKAKLENKRIPRLPNTGDESSIIIFAGTLIISLIGIGLFAIKNKKA